MRIFFFNLLLHILKTRFLVHKSADDVFSKKKKKKGAVINFPLGLIFVAVYGPVTDVTCLSIHIPGFSTVSTGRRAASEVVAVHVMSRRVR